MKKTIILVLVMFVLAIPSVTNAESNISYHQDIYSQNNTNFEEQARGQQERDKYQRERVERDNQQREQVEQDKQQRERVERERQQRERVEQDKQQRERVERERQQRERVERERQQRERVERDKQQRERVEREQQQRERVERDKQQRERMERERQQRERVERERHRQSQRDDHWRNGHHDWSHPKYNQGHWRPVERSHRGHMPFKWHERFDRHSAHHHMVLIEDRHWHDRFPGLRPYRWHGEGFWYRDRQIVDAIMFYNDYDELVSIGFYYDGIFIMIRDDDNYYEDHDPFFSLWFNILLRI